MLSLALQNSAILEAVNSFRDIGLSKAVEKFIDFAVKCSLALSIDWTELD